MKPKIEEKLNDMEELRGHIERLAPRNANGELGPAFQKCVEAIENYLWRYKDWKQRGLTNAR